MTRLMILRAVFLLVTLTAVGRADAYTEATHKHIVADAIEFMIASAGETAPYVDGATGQSDYQLLRSAFPNMSDAALRRTSEEIGQHSADTDRRTDIWLRVPGLFGSTPKSGSGGVSFTTFSHFINVRNPGFAWQFSGYYYGWVEGNQRCSDAGFEDEIANFFIGNWKARVDVQKSEAFTIYKDPLLPTISDAQYRDHFDQQIRYVHFWPLTNVAGYWLQKFVREPRAADGGPYNLQWIGPVLHAAADLTVPYHAAGLSGCGHGVYEDGVESLYDSGALYDRGTVKGMLAKEKHLDARLSVIDIVVGNARRAADSPFCKCGLGSCDCPIARDPKTARELGNLAVASTVTTLRKALLEWQAKGAPAPVILQHTKAWLCLRRCISDRRVSRRRQS